MHSAQPPLDSTAVDSSFASTRRQDSAMDNRSEAAATDADADAAEQASRRDQTGTTSQQRNGRQDKRQSQARLVDSLEHHIRPCVAPLWLLSASALCPSASVLCSASLSSQVDHAVALELRDYEMRLIDKQKKIIQQFEEVGNSKQQRTPQGTQTDSDGAHTLTDANCSH